MKRNYYSMTIIMAIILMAVSYACTRDNVSDRPNIVLILADDMGYSDIGCFGGDIETPNLDKLADEGTMFTHFYNTARCCPSRASILTGLHPHQTGLGQMVDRATTTDGYLGEINNNCVTLAEVLGASGYSTYMTGKWHVAYSQDGSDKHDWPLQRGFDRYYGLIRGASSYFDPTEMVNNNDTLLTTPDGFYMTNAVADSSVSFINDHFKMNKKNPFFMYVAFTAPHWPLQAPEEAIAKYRGKFDEGWDVMRERKLQRMKEKGLIDDAWDVSRDEWSVRDWESVENKEWELSKMEVYAAQVDVLDRGVGRIIKSLEDNGVLDNTLIIFLSDNGGCSETWSPRNPWAKNFGPEVTRDGIPVDYSNDGTGIPGPASTYFSYGPGWAGYSNTPFKGYKSGTLEGGISSPFIVYWKGKIKDHTRKRKQLAGIIDLMPTISEAAHAEYPLVYNGNAIIPYQGVSLIDAICNNRELARDDYYVEHIGNRAMVEDSKWKIVRYGRRNWQLFDIVDDRTETTNLADSLPQFTKQLADKWEKWAWKAKVLPKPGRNNR